MWNIQPLVGLGRLKFGLKQSDVAQLDNLGPVTATHPVIDGSVNEFRTIDVPVCNYTDGILTAIDTNWRVPEVTFEGIDVYKTEPLVILQLLEKKNGGALAGLGSILFLNLGINVGGFYDEETGKVADLNIEASDNRGVGLFTKSAFDKFLNAYQEISFL